MNISKDYQEHEGHVFYHAKGCRLCQEEAKKKHEAEELEKDRELHGRMADAFERSKRNVKR